MAPKKRATEVEKGKGLAASSGLGDEPESESQPAKGRSRRRTRDQILRDEREAWEASVKGRGVKNERHILRGTFPPDDQVNEAVVRQGLSFWFENNPGFNTELVEEFYRNIVLPEIGTDFHPGAVISSRVGRVELTVTPDVIAGALHYERPRAATNYPALNETFDKEAVLQTLYTRRGHAQIPHRVGKLKLPYRFALQLMCHNLDPREHEGRPSERIGNMMYAFLNEGTVCDWAQFIFIKMIEFRDAPTNTRLLFPCLISTIARASGQLASKYWKNDDLLPGAISLTTLRMSEAQSGGGGGDLLERPPANANVLTWVKKVFCLEVAVAKSHRKLKREVREVRRNQRIQTHQNTWLIQRMSGRNPPPYQPPTFQDREDSDDFEGSGSD